MKEQYSIAQNLFTVSVPESLPAWQALRHRFSPFAAEGGEPLLEIDVRQAQVPAREGTLIYEPENNGVGLITACASLLADGSIAIEFWHVEGGAIRVWMKMPQDFSKAEIILAPDGDQNDVYFLSHAIMIAYMLTTAENGTLMIHASAVMHEGRAYLFQGRSGTGKSTHARLWTQAIPGAELLNDDNPVIRFNTDGTAMAYGSPWSGKTHCYRNLSAPVGAFVRIVRAGSNELRPLSPIMAYASLTASVLYLPLFSDTVRQVRHATLERLVMSVPCCEMHCRPDADAALTCRAALSIQKNQPK